MNVDLMSPPIGSAGGAEVSEPTTSWLEGSEEPTNRLIAQKDQVVSVCGLELCIELFATAVISKRPGNGRDGIRRQPQLS